MPDDVQADATEEATGSDSEYDRFRALTAKLVKVPKKELDEARDREKAAKA
jgi:hypothetical protein